MTDITITDTFLVRKDKYNNHQPVWFDEGGKEIKMGKYKGQFTKADWKVEDVFFKNLSGAIHWGAVNGKLGLTEPETATIEEYILHLQNVERKIKELIQ